MITRARHDVTGAEAEFPSEVAGAWQRLGWQPISEPRSLQEAEQERIDEAAAHAARVAEVADLVAADKPPVIDEILTKVGGDPDAAAVALAAEQARANPRTTLVDRLTQITPTAGDAES